MSYIHQNPLASFAKMAEVLKMKKRSNDSNHFKELNLVLLMKYA